PDAMGRGHADHAAIDDEDHAPKGATDADAAPGDRLEDRLDVGGGASDHAQDLTAGSLPLQRGPHLPIPLRPRVILLLHLLEQPRVLDGDDGLIGEGLEEFDLSVGERAYLCASY